MESVGLLLGGSGWESSGGMFGSIEFRKGALRVMRCVVVSGVLGSLLLDEKNATCGEVVVSGGDYR